MQIDYPVIILVGLAAIFLIIGLIVKNKQDRKDYEKELNKTEFDDKKTDERNKM